MKSSIAAVTSGGHCPGINNVFANLILYGENFQITGFRNGWLGLSENRGINLSNPQLVTRLDASSLSFLGTSRLDPFLPGNESYLQNILANLANFDVVIAIGGEDTLGTASKLFDLGVPIIGIPKTLDNDLPETDFCVGFMSVVDNSIRAINSCKDTAFAHQRITVVETLGRHAGWVALYAGVGSFADWIVLPEFPLNSLAMCEYLLKNCRTGGLVVCAENVSLDTCNKATTVDGFKHELLRERGVAKTLAELIQKQTEIETRWTQLCDSVRGGFPNVFDRVLATRFARHALELAETLKFGRMVAIKNDIVTDVSLSCVKGIKKVPIKLMRRMWR